MKFVIYTKQGCVWCDRAKELLLDAGAPVETRDVHSSMLHFRFFQAQGFKSFPQVFREGPRGLEHIGGHDDLVKFLEGHP